MEHSAWPRTGSLGLVIELNKCKWLLFTHLRVQERRKQEEEEKAAVENRITWGKDEGGQKGTDNKRVKEKKF